MFIDYKGKADFALAALRLKFLQSPVQVFEFQNLADEEVAVSVGNLRVCDVNHVVVDIEIQLGARLELALQAAAAFGPHDVIHLMLEAEKLSRQLGHGALVVTFTVALVLIHE